MIGPAGFMAGPKEAPKPAAWYYYVSGGKGMTASGSFTNDKTRWSRFSYDDMSRLESGGIKPYGATRRGVFIAVC